MAAVIDGMGVPTCLNIVREGVKEEKKVEAAIPRIVVDEFIKAKPVGTYIIERENRPINKLPMKD